VAEDVGDLNAWQVRIPAAAARLRDARRVVVFTGAGVSKESGLATFRDTDGAWAQFNPEDYASPSGFRKQPRVVWQWYAHRRREMAVARPNPAHQAIATLEALSAQLVVITQNIDGLHQAAGSREVLELHGNIERFKCFANCRGAPTLVPTPDPTIEEPVRCPYCGAFIRPAVVWFHEMLPADVWERAAEAACTCDVMLVVGTSGLVEPAASLPRYAQQGGCYVIEINLEPTPLTARISLYLAGAAGEVLPALAAAALS